MSCRNAAMEAWPRSMSSLTMAGSVSIVAGCAAAPASRAWSSSGATGMKSARSRTVRSASPISGSDLPMPVTQAGAAGRRGEQLGDVDEQPPAGLGHRPPRRQLPHRQPQGLHRVGHHLLVTDGDVDVVRLIAGRGDREQRGDRPALDDLELIVGQAPLDVLGLAEVRLDPPAELSEPNDLRIGQALPLTAGLDRPFLRSACGHGADREPFGADALATTSPSRTR